MALLKNTTILGDLKVLNGPISNNGQPVVLDNDPRLIDAQTLNKQPASYYLNYNNLTNKPTDLATQTWVQNTATALAATKVKDANSNTFITLKYSGSDYKDNPDYLAVWNGYQITYGRRDKMTIGNALKLGNIDASKYATQTWVQNTAVAHQAASTTGTLTFTGASTETFNGNNSPVVHIPNDAITFSTDPTAKGQILRSMTIGDTTWVIAGTDNNIGITYEEI